MQVTVKLKNLVCIILSNITLTNITIIVTVLLESTDLLLLKLVSYNNIWVYNSMLFCIVLIWVIIQVTGSKPMDQRVI